MFFSYQFCYQLLSQILLPVSAFCISPLISQYIYISIHSLFNLLTYHFLHTSTYLFINVFIYIFLSVLLRPVSSNTLLKATAHPHTVPSYSPPPCPAHSPCPIKDIFLASASSKLIMCTDNHRWPLTGYKIRRWGRASGNTESEIGCVSTLSHRRNFSYISLCKIFPACVVFRVILAGSWNSHILGTNYNVRVLWRQDSELLWQDY